MTFWRHLPQSGEWSLTENKMIRPITINPVLNGFTVQVGCQTLAYISVDKLVLDLSSYLRNPEDTEKRIIDQEGINRRHTHGEPQVRGAEDCGIQTNQCSPGDPPMPLGGTAGGLGRIRA